MQTCKNLPTTSSCHSAAPTVTEYTSMRDPTSEYELRACSRSHYGGMEIRPMASPNLRKCNWTVGAAWASRDRTETEPLTVIARRGARDARNCCMWKLPLGNAKRETKVRRKNSVKKNRNCKAPTCRRIASEFVDSAAAWQRRRAFQHTIAARLRHRVTTSAQRACAVVANEKPMTASNLHSRNAWKAVVLEQKETNDLAVMRMCMFVYRVVCVYAALPSKWTQSWLETSQWIAEGLM